MLCAQSQLGMEVTSFWLQPRHSEKWPTLFTGLLWPTPWPPGFWSLPLAKTWTAVLSRIPSLETDR